MRILGLDPGLNHTGYGIIDQTGTRMCHVAHGVVHTTNEAALPERLAVIHRELIKILDQFQPCEAAVEETFVNANPRSALKLGMARGVILMTPALYALPVFEYAANHIKKSVVGVGHADKHQVAAMVQRLLVGCGEVSKDAADALAVAICHSQHARVNAFIAPGLRSSRAKGPY